MAAVMVTGLGAKRKAGQRATMTTTKAMNAKIWMGVSGGEGEGEAELEVGEGGEGAEADPEEEEEEADPPSDCTCDDFGGRALPRKMSMPSCISPWRKLLSTYRVSPIIPSCIAPIFVRLPVRV